MEHKKPPPTKDELAATRAAAWAWYQRGVGSEDMPVVEEVGVRRVQRATKPSRFKKEVEGKLGARGFKDGRVWEGSDVRGLAPTLAERRDYEMSYSSNSLLDMYEIEMISKRFESLVSQAGDVSREGEEVSRQGSTKSEKSYKSVKKAGKKLGGFWVMRPSAVCGSSGVVEPMRLVRKHRHEKAS